MKSVIFLTFIGLLVSAGDFELYCSPVDESPLFRLDSLWEQVNTCNLLGALPHMGIFYDQGTLWHVVNITSQPYVVYRMDTLGNQLLRFTHTTASYALGVCRAEDSIFVAAYQPVPERVNVYDTTGRYARYFFLSNNARCQGIDYDPVTKKFWVWGSPGSGGEVQINICDRNGTVSKTIIIAGGFWTYCGTIDRNYYPNRVWYAERQGDGFCYCSVDTAAGTGAILARFSCPGGTSYSRGITYLNQANQGFVWVTMMNSPLAYKMRVHARIPVEEEPAADIDIASFKIFPNPVLNDRVTFALPGDDESRVIVYDAKGSRVADLRGRDRITWSTNHLPAGVYFCRMKTGSEGSIKKLVIVK